MKYFFSFFFIFFVSMGLFAQDAKISKVLKKMNKSSIPYVYVKDLIANDSVIFLDAREPQEYAVSKIPGALYVGYNDFNIYNIKDAIKNKNKKIIVYCSIGVRSEKIGTEIKNAGYKNVSNLWGGIFEWKNEGKTLVDSNNKITDRVHVYSKQWGAYLKKGIKIY